MSTFVADGSGVRIAGVDAGKRQVSISLGEFQALAPGTTTITKAFTGSALPPGARILGGHLLVSQMFAAPTLPGDVELPGTAVVKPASGSASIPVGLTTITGAGEYGALYGWDARTEWSEAALELSAFGILPWGGSPEDAIDLSTLTAGAVTVTVFYAVFP